MFRFKIGQIFRWQIDAELSTSSMDNDSEEISRKHELGDSIMTAIVLDAFDSNVVSQFVYLFTDLGRLRVQETSASLRCGRN